jgi:CheY-like chemotaxis protein
MSDNNKHIILYAEDDLDDLFIVRQAFETYNSTINVVHAENGYQAIKYLDALKPSDQLPCLIILDMNMPGMDGRETLVRLRKSDVYSKIPVVIFTTSSSKPDQEFAAKWGADFITKPVKYSDLQTLAKMFVDHCEHEIKKRA